MSLSKRTSLAALFAITTGCGNTAIPKAETETAAPSYMPASPLPPFAVLPTTSPYVSMHLSCKISQNRTLESNIFIGVEFRSQVASFFASATDVMKENRAFMPRNENNDCTVTSKLVDNNLVCQALNDNDIELNVRIAGDIKLKGETLIATPFNKDGSIAATPLEIPQKDMGACLVYPGMHLKRHAL